MPGEVILETLLLPAVSVRPESHAIDDLELRNEPRATRVVIPPINEHEPPERQQIDFIAPAGRPQEEVEGDPARPGLFVPHYGELPSTRDIPTLPILNERHSPVTEPPRSGLSVAQRRRSALVGVCAAVALITLAYGHHQGHLETGARAAVTWLEQARILNGVFGRTAKHSPNREPASHG